ncbi:acyl-CoA/acyl-ACP dehydrogenase [Nocardia sp. 2]|uniref:Acyl-CoA/acyl-ACP dehydrogenase n=1 Tax=Nocardia acididurans TaxID=2802282 RepID=A0ABS1M0H5_9NOCA|nr:acyl-CoA dehydrogenase family protein [Nocardia acididurans]MBL1074167.1 acyl-CoA/acyl-ACP dehydrogenase [Nocardia acididurans]
MTNTRLLQVERDTFESYLPALAKALSARPLAELESRNSDALALFKQHDGPALIFPVELGGLGASALDATRVYRALGALSPSLGAGTTMHQLSVAALLTHARAAGSEADLELYRGVAAGRLLLSSGFSEGQPGGTVFKPTVLARPVEGGYLVTGRKQPCSLARSMDLLTASVAEDRGDRARRGVIVIPADSPGISVEPFWDNPILAAAESDAVVLTDVFVPENLLLWSDEADPDGQFEQHGYIWFGLLISATYLGAASAVVERLLLSGKADAATYTVAACELEASMAALEGIACAFDAGDRSTELSARMLFCREALKGALHRAVIAAMDGLGGISFIKNPEVTYLASAVHAAGFHPPSKRATADTLLNYHATGVFGMS